MSLINLIEFKTLGDDRGNLISLEENKNIPFDIKRVYYLFGTKDGVSRGFHAHKELKQIAVCLTGSCKFIMDDGKEKEEILLDSNSKGLLVDVMQWHEMYDFSENCVLMVLASDYYDESDYIRNYENFLGLLECTI